VSLASASDRQLALLATIDPLLFALTLAATTWAFGWRTTAVVLVWIGTSHLTRYFWIGGSILRWDWLSMTVVAVCLAQKGRFVPVGLALAYAAAVRVFPVFLLGAAVLRQMARRDDAEGWRNLARIAAGFTAGLAIIVTLSGIVVGGGPLDMSIWREFRDDNFRQINSPTGAKTGLRTIVSFEPSTRGSEMQNLWIDTPWDTWRDARRQTFAERQPFFWLAVACWTALFAWAARRMTLTESLAAGAAFVPVLIEVAAYYQVILAVLALLWLRDRRIGIAIALASAATCIAPALTDWDDVLHVMMSAIVMTLVTAVLIVIGRRDAATRSPVLP
jgi:hypothetical protein